MNILNKTRQITGLLQKNQRSGLNEIAELLKDLIDANVFIISPDGELKAYSSCHEYECDILKDKVLKKNAFSREYLATIKKIRETTVNIVEPENRCTFFKKSKCIFLDKTSTVVPIYGNGSRIATLVCVKYDGSFTEEEVILAEYAAIIISVSILQDIISKETETIRKKAMIDVALSTLSYSETEAIKAVLGELNGSEGILIASKIADRVGITRSVIVNALRKFESAGLIETRSLGMKGTYIIITNDILVYELDMRFGILKNKQ